jgi:hypothetical protein
VLEQKLAYIMRYIHRVFHECSKIAKSVSLRDLFFSKEINNVRQRRLQ